MKRSNWIWIPTLTLLAAAEALVGCRGSNTLDDAAGGGSLVTAIGGMSEDVRKLSKPDYKLFCADAVTGLAAATPVVVKDSDATKDKVAFKAAGVKVGQFCMIEIIATVELDKFSWLIKTRTGLLYKSNAAKVSDKRTLTINIYKTHKSIGEAQFKAVVEVTFPEGAELSGLDKTKSNIECVGKTGSVATVWEGANQAVQGTAKKGKLTFGLTKTDFATKVSCKINSTTGLKDYVSTASFDVINTQEAYTTTVDLKTAVTDDISIISTGADCTLNAAGTDCVDGTAVPTTDLTGEWASACVNSSWGSDQIVYKFAGTTATYSENKYAVANCTGTLDAASTKAEGAYLIKQATNGSQYLEVALATVSFKSFKVEGGYLYVQDTWTTTAPTALTVNNDRKFTKK